MLISELEGKALMTPMLEIGFAEVWTLLWFPSMGQIFSFSILYEFSLLKWPIIKPFVYNFKQHL